MTTRCCIAGGGPAGVMLGFLLARAGVEVVVLEKHADFFRDFRGDTIHPSTLELMHELGLLDEFLKLPHQKVERLGAQIGEAHIGIADFTHLPTVCKYIALMPQWDFLDFLAARGKRYSGFDLRMSAEAVDLIEEGGRIAGVIAKTPDGELSVRADLVVGADGRHSTVRQRAGLVGDDYGAPMDVLWFRVPRKGSDTNETFGHVEAGAMMVMLDRGDYWQCAFVIPKGGIESGSRPRASMPSAAGSSPSRRSWPTGSARSRTGTISSCSASRSIGCAGGGGRGSSASATRRMRCRRSAASASISPFRTRSPPRTFLPRRSRRAA
jgi:2-polyprenyl-6-methoxyphenol hydroxylase-like FAD-dependent oxidoreductase